MRRLVALAAAAGSVVYLRRRAAAREHVEVRFEDGSAVTLESGPHADALLAIARSAF
jgi:hypothetical protein